MNLKMFYEEAKLNDELTCVKCNQRLNEPRILPCGEFICAYCFISIETNSNKFKCFVCDEDHLLPKKGLPINKRLSRILALKSKEVSRGEKAKKLKEHLDSTQEYINKFSCGIDNGIERIKELCLDLKNKVQLKTEEAVEQLNEHNKQMITEIEQFAKDSIKFYQANAKANNEFRKTKQELEEFNLKWNVYLKQTVISDEDVSEAIAQASELSLKAKKELAKLNELDEFIFNGAEMKFERNENKLDRLVLGKLGKHPFIDQSAILSNEQMTELMILCKFSLNQKWKLIYKATRDGFGAADFHSKCDSYQNSLVIFKSTNGNVFGGYTKQSWSGYDQWKSDQNSFLFSFINQHDKKIVMKFTKDSQAINADSKYGPIFGMGIDLLICNNSNTRNESFSNLGYNYKHPSYAYDSKEAKSFLAGSHKFCTTEIEVYTKE